MNRRKIVLIMMVVLFSMNVGCTANKTKSKVSYEVLSINDAKTGTYFICDNSQRTYIYQMVGDVYGIYDYETGELLIPTEDSSSFQFMAASDSCLAYYSEENNGTLYIYSTKDYSLLNKIDQIKVFAMKGDKDKIFIAQDNNIHAKKYDVMVVMKDSYIWLGEKLDNEGQKPLNGNYAYYQWEGYDIAVSGKDIIYIEKDAFQFSISVNANYVKSNNDIYLIEQQPSFLPDITGAHGGVSAQMINEQDGICYFIAQYSKRDYRVNPNCSFVEGSILCKYSLEDGNFDVLYEAKKDEQIVGLSDDKTEIFIVTEDGLFRRNLGTNEETLLLTNKFKENDYRGTYFFESYGQGIVVFSVGLRINSGPVYEGFYE